MQETCQSVRSPIQEGPTCLWETKPIVNQLLSCVWLCNPMDCSMPGFPILYHLPELAQIHVHWIGDAIQPSRPLSSPFPPAFNLSQHQGLFQRQLFASGGQRIGASASAAVLPKNIQGWFPVGLIGLISLHSKGLSRVFPVPQFESINSLMLSLLYGPTLTSVHDYWKNFNKNIIPIHEPLLSWSNHLPEVPPANTITLGIKILTYELWRDTDIQSIARCYWNVVGRDQGCV